MPNNRAVLHKILPFILCLLMLLPGAAALAGNGTHSPGEGTLAPEVTFTFPEAEGMGSALYLRAGVPVLEEELLENVTAVDEKGGVLSVTVLNTGGLNLLNPEPLDGLTPYQITYGATHPETGEVKTALREAYVIAIRPLAATGAVVTVSGLTAGGLQNSIVTALQSTGLSPGDITSLTITGSMNTADLSYITGTLTGVAELYLSGATLNGSALPVKQFFMNTTLERVSLPDNVTIIGERAFFGCEELTAIDLPATLTSIGASAFSGCVLLRTINLPVGLTSIGERAFSGCSGLTAVNPPAGLTSIGDFAFENCRALAAIDLRNGMTSIGNGVFFGCAGLATIDMPANLTAIGNAAFSGCTSLTEITLPAGLAAIGDNAFSDGGTAPSNFTFAGTNPPASWGTNTFANRTVEKISAPDGSERAYINALTTAGYSDLTSKARSSTAYLTVTWQTNGGSPAPAQTAVEGNGTITLPGTVNRDGYTFGGWYKEDTFQNEATFPDQGVFQNLMYYAKWTGNVYGITYQLNGGTGASAGTYTCGTGLSLPTPTRPGYTFGGWYDDAGPDGNPVTGIPATDTGTKTFYARWITNDYAITYELNGGTGETSGSYAHGVGLTLPVPTRTGHTFKGWYVDAGFDGSPVTALSAADAGDKTFFAKWAAKVYAVSYALNGGAGTTGGSYTYGVGLTLPIPSRTEYTFGGWFADSGFAGTPATAISAADMGDKTFYAKWTSKETPEEEAPKTYTLSLRPSEGVKFGYQREGFEPRAKGATVVNAGNQGIKKITLSLTGKNPEAFELSETAVHDLAPGDSASFEVTPAEGLSEGEYKASILAKGPDNREEIPVTLTVTGKGEESPAYVISVEEFLDGTLRSVLTFNRPPYRITEKMAREALTAARDEAIALEVVDEVVEVAFVLPEGVGAFEVVVEEGALARLYEGEIVSMALKSEEYYCGFDLEAIGELSLLSSDIWLTAEPAKGSAAAHAFALTYREEGEKIDILEFQKGTVEFGAAFSKGKGAKVTAIEEKIIPETEYREGYVLWSGRFRAVYEVTG